MKAAHILIAAVILVAVTASFFISNIIPTGLLTAVPDGDGIRITGTKTTETTAEISWETAKESASTLIINNNPTSFSKAKEFSSKTSGLNEGTTYQYTIRALENFKLSRDELNEYLNKKGIGTGIYYPKPLHLLPHLKKFGYKEGDFPIAEKLSNQVISLPVHPHLAKEQLDYIIKVFNEI